MITNEEDKQKEFINATLQQLKENISNFITSTNYSNIQSLYLRQQIDDYQKEFNRLNQQKIYQRQLSENSTLKNEIVLPLLLNSKNPKLPYKKESLYSPQTSYRKKESKKKPEKERTKEKE
jgi:protease II